MVSKTRNKANLNVKANRGSFLLEMGVEVYEILTYKKTFNFLPSLFLFVNGLSQQKDLLPKRIGLQTRVKRRVV